MSQFSSLHYMSHQRGRHTHVTLHACVVLVLTEHPINYKHTVLFPLKPQWFNYPKSISTQMLRSNSPRIEPQCSIAVPRCQVLPVWTDTHGPNACPVL